MDRRVTDVVGLLEADLRRSLRVGDLAALVGLGASRLEHLFKLETKTSIREFLRERRLLEAAKLMTTTEERISAIAFGVGYADVSNFNHAFKRRFGVSPRQYRTQARDECGPLRLGGDGGDDDPEAPRPYRS